MRVIAPGILVAATGVGAGDLLTASIAGSNAGLVLLWAAAWGAVLKWTLNEGIARWQLATESTILEGWLTRLGGWVQWIFVPYFFLWSFLVGGRFRSGWVINAILVITLLLFAYMGVLQFTGGMPSTGG